MHRQQLRKYFIMGSQNCNRNPCDVLKEAIEAGITIYQFREKGKGALVGQEKIKLGQQLREICRINNIPFIVNDDVELVETLDADGIHVGQEDTDVDRLRRRYPDKIIGLSISNMSEFNNSSINPVDYIGAGPVFGTKTKDDAKLPVGTEWINQLRVLVPNIPIVGIGGITPDNASKVIDAGAAGVAVISAISKSTNIYKTVQAL